MLIDEYQDTNHAQFMIANTLASRDKNICATGDPDQSIYGWRGANLRNILDFETHYPDAKVVRLEQNYRSTGQILAAADALIRHNRGRKHKGLWTENAEGDRVRVVECVDERHEARWLAERFQDLHDAGTPWGGMAVFYRINSLSRVVEDALRDAAIPYQVARGTAFYERAEIKHVVAYLRTIVNPADEVSMLRVINTPSRGIGDKSIKAMQAFALANDLPIDRVIRDPRRVTSLSARAQNSVARFARLLDRWREEADLESLAPRDAGEPELSLRAFVEKVIRESGLHALYADDDAAPDEERLANLGEFVSFAQQFEEEFVTERAAPNADGGADDGPDTGADADDQTRAARAPTLAEKLLGLLERVSLISDVDGVDPDQGAVTLMTLHAAKGLEFPVVAMVGVEDGLLPHKRALEDKNEMEEERRLCFVGITRAMRTLLLTHARYRTIFGQTLPTVASRFLGELPDEAVEREEIEGDEAFGGLSGSDQRSRARQRAMAFPPGCVVAHPDFGVGTVLDVAPMGAQTRARIRFDEVGDKTLILQYAHLERIG